MNSLPAIPVWTRTLAHTFQLYCVCAVSPPSIRGNLVWVAFQSYGRQVEWRNIQFDSAACTTPRGSSTKGTTPPIKQWALLLQLSNLNVSLLPRYITFLSHYKAINHVAFYCTAYMTLIITESICNVNAKKVKVKTKRFSAQAKRGPQMVMLLVLRGKKWISKPCLSHKSLGDWLIVSPCITTDHMLSMHIWQEVPTGPQCFCLRVLKTIFKNKRVNQLRCSEVTRKCYQYSVY